MGLPAYEREQQCSKHEQQNHLFTHQNTNLNINYFKVSSKDTIRFCKWNVTTQVLTCSACPSILELSFGLGRTCHFCQNNKSLYRLSGGFGEFMLNYHFISNSPETPSNDCVKERLIIVATVWQRQPDSWNSLMLDGTLSHIPTPMILWCSTIWSLPRHTGKEHGWNS
jgi:hypothetical protein